MNSYFVIPIILLILSGAKLYAKDYRTHIHSAPREKKKHAAKDALENIRTVTSVQEENDSKAGDNPKPPSKDPERSGDDSKGSGGGAEDQHEEEVHANKLKDPIHDKANFITYHTGAVPIFVSAPHGGLKELDDVPIRADAEGKPLPGSTHVTDGWTRSLGLELHAALRELGLDASLAVSEFRRKYIDINRGIDDQAKDYELNDRGKELWNAYHDKIKAFQERWEGKNSLLVDIHAHARHDTIMVGLGIWAENLKILHETGSLDPSPKRQDDFTLNADFRDKVYEGVFGSSSFGSILQDKMKDDVFQDKPTTVSPSSSMPEVDRYLRGGYIVRSYKNDFLNGVQIESPKYLRKDKSIRQAYVNRIAETILLFCHEHGVKTTPEEAFERIL